MIMADEKWIVGIDIGGTNFRIAAVTDEGKTKLFHKIPVHQVIYTDNVLEDLVDYLQNDFFKALRKEGIIPKALSIGFPATLDRERKMVIQAPNIPFMEKLPVVDVLFEKLGIPVIIDRDVNMALVYDQRKYKIPECDVLAGCYFGTGIGNALQIFGKMLPGRNGTAGELGHIPVDMSEEICGCGNIGCMENLAGGKYLARLCKEVFVDTPIADIFTKHCGEQLIWQYIGRMAITIATEINILNPDYMFIGGGVVNMTDFPKDLLFQRVREHARKPYPAQDLEKVLIFTEDEEDKCVIGAALLAAQRMEKETIKRS